MRFRMTFILAAVVTITGCANGHSCGQFPQSGCQPVSSVNERTNGEITDYRRNLNRDDAETDKKVTVNISPVPNALNFAAPGDFILTKPLVLRVLINSWEDEQKNLHAGGYVFVRVKESQWTIKN